MIVVVGRPGLTAAGELDRPAGRIAAAASAAGGRVELVGSVADDADGDNVAVELGRAGVGHAALLRDPGAVGGDDADALPRLDAADIELAMRYLADCHVLVIAEPLDPDAMSVAVDAAAYHGAALVVLKATGGPDPQGLPEPATLLEMPEEDGGAFAALVARYVAQLDVGRPPDEAWQEAVGGAAWEPTSG